MSEQLFTQLIVTILTSLISYIAASQFKLSKRIIQIELNLENLNGKFDDITNKVEKLESTLHKHSQNINMALFLNKKQKRLVKEQERIISEIKTKIELISTKCTYHAKD